MKNKIIYFALCVSAYFQKAKTDAETVWLKDVTTRLQTDKRGVTGADLPDQLSFHLKRRTHALVLNLKRNYHIDPNADIYIVQTLKDGRPVLEKSQNLETNDMAYYQDIENGAFMTARCVKRSSGQCDILINGNIRLGDRSYDLRSSEVDVIPNDFLEITGLHGKRYILQDRANIQKGMSVDNNDKPRNLNRYHVDVVVLADSGLWELFVLIARSTEPNNIPARAKTDLREYLVHIINGADQLYRGIHDPSIEITVSIRAFVIFQTEGDFPHIESKVGVHDTQKVIDGDKYFRDLKYWDINIGSRNLPAYDQAILFTRHVMYEGTLDKTDFDGLSLPASVCDIGRRVEIVRVTDYYKTTSTAAHELGHALGALHDGDNKDDKCSSNDFFIMSSLTPTFHPNTKYTGNPWMFSQCSVESFKRTLVNKACVTTKHIHDQELLAEFQKILRQQPGVRFPPDIQCVIINGFGSRYCEENLEQICRFMRCTDPETKECEDKYYSAATGTTCGNNKMDL